MAKLRFALHRVLLAAGAFASAASPCFASDDGFSGQIHGFVSQAAVFSDGNNIGGNSKSGSLRFTEVGLNGSLRRNNLMFAGQVVSVRNPIAGSADAEIDYAVLDYTYFNTARDAAGIRLGRPKIAFGLYGDVRDVAAARPGIFLPDGIYFSSFSSRELFFSRNGAQVYWNHFGGSYSLKTEVNWLAKTEAKNTVEFQVFGQDMSGEFELESGYAGRVQHVHFDSGITTSLTFVDAEAEFSAFPLDVSFSQATGSAQLARESWVFTSELMRREVGASGGRGGIRVAGYLEARRIFSNEWEGFIRYEEFWREIGDRSGREYAAKENRPEHSGYAFETGIGLKRNFTNGISVLAEVHYIDGSGTVDRLANLDAFTGPPAGQGDSSLLASSWSYMAFQLAYKF